MDEEEVEQIKEEAQPPAEPVQKKKNKHLAAQVDTHGLSDAEKESVANREKDKGNEVGFSFQHMHNTSFSFIHTDKFLRRKQAVLHSNTK